METKVIETKLSNVFNSEDKKLGFDVNTPQFLKEACEGANGGMYAVCYNIFKGLLAQVAERATELHDPVLDALMIRLNLYEVASEKRYEILRKLAANYDAAMMAQKHQRLRKLREHVSDDTMTIRKEWFEQCKKSWYNEGYLDGKHNRDSQFVEPVSEDLGEYINELSKQFPEVSFAKLSRIAVRVAKWQKQKDMVIFNELAELANHQDGCYALEAIQMRLNGIINED